jgi:hypothetical protein
MTPLAVAQGQLEAYNRRDLEAFLAFFSDEVRIYRLPALSPAIDGKPALREFYASQRFNREGLHAELLGRTVLGDKVFDHERIHGLGEQPVETMAVFAVEAGRIHTAWFFSP